MKQGVLVLQYHALVEVFRSNKRHNKACYCGKLCARAIVGDYDWNCDLVCPMLP